MVRLRANRTILQMLRATAVENPAEWPNRMPAVLAAYRMTLCNDDVVSTD